MPNNQNVTLVVRGGIFGTHNFGKSFSPKEKPFKFCQYFILDVNFENLTVELYICYVFNTRQISFKSNLFNIQLINLFLIHNFRLQKKVVRQLWCDKLILTYILVHAQYPTQKITNPPSPSRLDFQQICAVVEVGGLEIFLHASLHI